MLSIFVKARPFVLLPFTLFWKERARKIEYLELRAWLNQGLYPEKIVPLLKQICVEQFEDNFHLLSPMSLTEDLSHP